MAILHPGTLSIEQRQNLEAVQFKPPIVPVFFEFSIRQYRATENVVSIPKDSIITSPVFIRVITPFDGSNTFLHLKLDSDQDVGSVSVITPGVLSFSPNVTSETRFLTRTPAKSTLSFGIVELGDVEPTRGRGWVLLQYVNLNLIGV